MVTVMDQTTDPNGQTLHKLTKLYDPPEFVKAASHDAITGKSLGQLPPTAYGDPRTSQFPIDTPASTYVSMMYFLDARPGLGKMAAAVEQRIDDAAQYFGIAGHVRALKEKHAANQKHELSQLADDDFAAVIQYEGGRVERHLPLRNAGEVKAAFDFLGQWSKEFVYADRRAISERVLRKAASLGGLTDEEEQKLTKMAGWGVGSAEGAAEALYKRAQALRTLGRSLELQEALAETAVACLQNPQDFHAPANMQKIASFIDQVDREQGLLHAGLGDPEDLFQFTVKEASDFEDGHVQLTTGTVYKKADLRQLDLADVQGVMGSQFAEMVSAGGVILDVEKLAEQLKTLPRGDARLFDQLAEAAQVEPLAKQAADDGAVGRFYDALASLHQ
jgi:hypothetical protein